MTDSAEPSLWGDLHPIVGNFDGADIGEDVGGDVGVDAGPVRLRYYGGAVSAHTATRGLFTGIWLRHVAVRSVGMIARFRLGPQ
jgi:hypothetical protein